MNENENLTVVFGFSENPDRYSNKAFHLLKEFEHNVVGFNPRNDDLNSLPNEFDTLTMYVGAELSTKYMDELLKFNFKRIIFNPGSENELLESKVRVLGKEIVHGCTLVMLKTDQY